MNELTPFQFALTFEDGIPYADSRVVASRLDLDHGNMLESIDRHSERFTRFKPLNRSERGAAGGRPSRYLLLPRDAVTMIVAICRPTPATLDWQEAIIEAFRRLERAATSAIQSLVPKTLGEALRLAADLHDEVVALETQVATLEPKAEAFDTFLGADGDYAIGAASQMLAREGVKIGEKRLFQWLRDNGLARYDANGVNVPYQTAVDDRLLRLRAVTYPEKRTVDGVVIGTGAVRTTHQLRITPKGVAYVRRNLKAELKAMIGGKACQ